MEDLRKNYEESCQRLQPNYLSEGNIPPQPSRMPQHDDEGPLGVSFFRTFLGEGEDLCNLTLPRTFLRKSEVNDVSFQNTDLQESNLCWNDFINVDLTSAILIGSDIRSSIFQNVIFNSADLGGADFRGSTFENCDFTNAKMEGTFLTRTQGFSLNLSKSQKKEIKWCWLNGPEPGGG